MFAQCPIGLEMEIEIEPGIRGREEIAEAEAET
jgi:hypothetical protein